MKCSQCKKHFMTHDTSYTDSLPSEEQIKQEFVTGKGNGSHISLLRLLRSELTVAQVQRYIEDEVRQHYYFLKSEFLDLWDKALCSSSCKPTLWHFQLLLYPFLISFLLPLN